MWLAGKLVRVLSPRQKQYLGADAIADSDCFDILQAMFVPVFSQGEAAASNSTDGFEDYPKCKGKALVLEWLAGLDEIVSDMATLGELVTEVRLLRRVRTCLEHIPEARHVLNQCRTDGDDAKFTLSTLRTSARNWAVEQSTAMVQQGGSARVHFAGVDEAGGTQDTAPKGSRGSVSDVPDHRTLPRGECKFHHSSRGCLKGAECGFLHDGVPAAEWVPGQKRQASVAQAKPSKKSKGGGKPKAAKGVGSQQSGSYQSGSASESGDQQALGGGCDEEPAVDERAVVQFARAFVGLFGGAQGQGQVLAGLAHILACMLGCLTSLIGVAGEIGHRSRCSKSPDKGGSGPNTMALGVCRKDSATPVEGVARGGATGAGLTMGQLAVASVVCLLTPLVWPLCVAAEMSGWSRCSDESSEQCIVTLDPSPKHSRKGLARQVEAFASLDSAGDQEVVLDTGATDDVIGRSHAGDLDAKVRVTPTPLDTAGDRVWVDTVGSKVLNGMLQFRAAMVTNAGSL